MMRLLTISFLLLSSTTSAFAGSLGDLGKEKALPSADAATPNFERALQLYEARKFVEAIPLLHAAMVDEPAHVNRRRARFFLGKALYETQQYEQAAETFDLIIDAGPQDPYYVKTLWWMAVLLHMQGDGPEPFPLLERIAKYRDDAFTDRQIPESVRDEILFRVGGWYRAHGQQARGTRLWAAISPTSSWADRAEGRLGEPAPSEPPSRALALAMVQFSDLHFAEAAISFEKLLAANGETPFNRQRARYFLGRCYFNLQRYEQAASTFGAIVDEGPRNPYYRWVMPPLAAMVIFQRSEPEKFPLASRLAKYSDDMLTDYVVEDPKTTDSYRRRGRDAALYWLGRWLFAHGETARGRKLLAAIDKKHELYPAAQLLRPGSLVPSPSSPALRFGRLTKSKEAATTPRAEQSRAITVLDPGVIPANWVEHAEKTAERAEQTHGRRRPLLPLDRLQSAHR